MNDIIGWPMGVNKKILDSTSITVGEKGYSEDAGDAGVFSERRLNSLYAPDTYPVSMDFNWLEKDENGKSELDRFVDWYKYRHKRGVKPFEFPAISNFNIRGSIKTCYYKIISAPTMQKSGFCMRVSMQWTEVYRGLIEIPDAIVSVNTVEVKVGQLKCKAKITFTKSFDTEPREGAYPLFISAKPLGQETVAHFVMADTQITSSYGNFINYTFLKPTEKGIYYAIIATKKDNTKPDNTEFTADELEVLTQGVFHTFEVK